MQDCTLEQRNTNACSESTYIAKVGESSMGESAPSRR